MRDHTCTPQLVLSLQYKILSSTRNGSVPNWSISRWLDNIDWPRLDVSANQGHPINKTSISVIFIWVIIFSCTSWALIYAFGSRYAIASECYRKPISYNMQEAVPLKVGMSNNVDMTLTNYVCTDMAIPTWIRHADTWHILKNTCI